MISMTLMLFPRLRPPQCGVSPLAAAGGSATGSLHLMATHAIIVSQLTAVVRSRLPAFVAVRPPPLTLPIRLQQQKGAWMLAVLAMLPPLRPRQGSDFNLILVMLKPLPTWSETSHGRPMQGASSLVMVSA